MSISPARRDDWIPIAAVLMLGSIAFARLMSLPAFGDEGSQLRWIFRMIQAGEWLAPLGEGKPLEAWPMVPLVRLGVPTLAAARALHVLAGMVGAVLTYRLARQLGDRRRHVLALRELLELVVAEEVDELGGEDERRPRVVDEVDLDLVVLHPDLVHRDDPRMGEGLSCRCRHQELQR